MLHFLTLNKQTNPKTSHKNEKKYLGSETQDETPKIEEQY